VKRNGFPSTARIPRISAMDVVSDGFFVKQDSVVIRLLAATSSSLVRCLVNVDGRARGCLRQEGAGKDGVGRFSFDQAGVQRSSKEGPQMRARACQETANQ